MIEQTKGVSKLFFPEKITHIADSDRVLEIGPGGSPHPRSDVLLEIDIKDERIARKQRGLADKLATEKPIVYYDGKCFPFADRTFDYVICSHVIEHVEDVESFCAELFRISHRGYLEYPTIYYEYLYNFSVHLNFLKLKNGTLFYSKKDEWPMNDFLPVQFFYYHTLERGYVSLVDALKYFMFEGFEWDSSFELKHASCMDELVYDRYVLPEYQRSADKAGTPDGNVLAKPDSAVVIGTSGGGNKETALAEFSLVQFLRLLMRNITGKK